MSSRYRIIKHQQNEKVWFRIQRRYMFVFWSYETEISHSENSFTSVVRAQSYIDNWERKEAPVTKSVVNSFDFLKDEENTPDGTYHRR